MGGTGGTGGEGGIVASLNARAPQHKSMRDWKVYPAHATRVAAITRWRARLLGEV